MGVWGVFGPCVEIWDTKIDNVIRNKPVYWMSQYSFKYVVLQFYVSFCCLDNVLRWERAVQDDEDELETAKQSEQKQMADIERDMRRLDVLKSERLAKKSEVDSMDDLIGKVCNWLYAACYVLKTVVFHVLGPMKVQYLNHIIPLCTSINGNAMAQACHSRGIGSVQGWSMWDSWWRNCHWYRVCSKYSLLFHQSILLIHLYILQWCYLILAVDSVVK